MYFPHYTFFRQADLRFMRRIISLIILISNSFLVRAHNSTIDSSEAYIIIKKIEIKGNKSTKPHIIHRELLFAEEDTIFLNNYEQLITQSANNLNNTSLFNFVFIDTNEIAKHKTLTINLIERWYFWPMPYFDLSERNFNTWWETKDFNKINYGLYLIKDNFRGRRENFRVFFRRGFEETYSLSYNVPNLNKKQTLGIGMSFGFSRNKEIPFQVNENKLEYFRVEDFYIREYLFGTLQLNYRKDYYQTHALWLSYNNLFYEDTLIMQNDYFSKDGMRRNHYLSVNYFYKDDHRDVRAYPLNGYYFDFDINKYGLGLLKKEAANVFFIRATYRNYFKLHKNLYFALGQKIKYANPGFQPFYLKRGLGFGNDYVRGYDYYVVDGISYWVAKNNIKYELVSPRTKRIKFIKSEKFNMIHYAMYFNLFFDAGYAHEYRRAYKPSNDLTYDLLYGYGAGLDVVTYYDKVFRIEYAINKMKEHGFFFNFVAPI